MTSEKDMDVCEEPRNGETPGNGHRAVGDVRQESDRENDAVDRDHVTEQVIVSEHKESYAVYNNGKKAEKMPETEKMLPEDVEDMYRDMPLTKDTSCGFWIFQGPLLQRFANKKVYVFMYGVVGCIFSATYAYFNGTITTLEKRYKIPSKNTGIISVGNDISALLLSAILSYYAGKGHRPRWIAFGLLMITVFCWMTALPHLLYGPGEAALSLTTEYGATYDANQTLEVMEAQKAKTLCRTNATRGAECEREEGTLAPQIVLFVAQFISGIGSSLYYTLGVSYMDDNIKKSKTPALVSVSYFLRMLGPAIGYALASYFLKLYISPSMTPTISNTDPRWLGAWWMGWLILGAVLSFFAIFIAMFPKQLPRAAVRQRIAQEKRRLGMQLSDASRKDDELPASFKDMLKTFKRLLRNKILMLNNIASVFYFFGYMPYWIFTPKYIETQYKQSASTSSLVTGTVALCFSAIGVLLSGLVISKFKPRARYMAAWNVIVGVLSVMGMIAYAFLGCTASEDSVIVNIPSQTDLTPTCNSACQCDYVKYSPICGEDGNTYISACHAGCRRQNQYGDLKIYGECACITSVANYTSPLYKQLLSDGNRTSSTRDENAFALGGSAIAGPCPLDCHREFVTFLVVMCFLKFSGATGRASNFLVSVRCVDEKDKAVSMGFGMMVLSLMSFIPSPIFFGLVLDKTCLVWGKTCTGTGNCWLYDGETLRYLLNFIAAAFVLVGTLFDCGVWYYVKDLKIFDDEVKDKEIALADKEEEAITDRPALACIMNGSLANGLNEGLNAPPPKIAFDRSISVYSERDVQCGFWVCRGPFWQRLASKKLYVLLFGLIGCILNSTTSYFYGTLTTVEKSIQISSRTVGIITAGSDLSFVLASLFLSYYASNRRKPLWIAMGIVSMALSCFVNALPHFLFSKGHDELVQTAGNWTKGADNLCREDRLAPDCSLDVGDIRPQLVLFFGSFLSGIGTSLYFTLGLTYLDDNVRKEKVPFLSSVAAFGRRMGPLVGFSLASLSLKYFVHVGIDPGYNQSDPRWIGAWWMGWLVLGSTLIFIAPFFASFPKVLPRTAERISLSRQASRTSGTNSTAEEDVDADRKVSFSDMLVTVRRLITNKAYVFNNAASIFYFFGYMPFFLFQAKYIEIQYRLTPSQANMVTGSVSLVFSALGILIAGMVIQKLRVTSRQLAGWNVITSILSAAGIVGYAWFGCSALNNADIVSNSQDANCSLGCNCDFVKYAPICGSDGQTYLSPCHAGCRELLKDASGTSLYTNCSCIPSILTDGGNVTSSFGSAIPGSCPVDCWTPFYFFLIVMCLNKFIGGTESAANFLIGLRCVEPRDKAISMGFSMAINTLFSFLPAPIIFGAIIDRTCVLWGRTCAKRGNCWLYDGEALRVSMNYTAAVFVIIGTCFDMGTWYYSKNFKIFDDAPGEEDSKVTMEKELVSLVNKEKKDPAEVTRIN
uniref:Kazal-like domain-containing protein n=1 Tax=Anopheles minimus TaxID=112268 RepID=A0A182WBM8_9DIPT